MEKSPLRFLKDYDIITMINNEVISSKRKLTRIFHINTYKDRIHNNNNLFKKILIDDTFWRINKERIKNKHVVIIPPEFPFINNSDNSINVKHAIRIFQKYLLEIEDNDTSL
tara:strand:+ start:129 stop:464 length:336 start_codon:yes stop_codon:yes gene_type:complete